MPRRIFRAKRRPAFKRRHRRGVRGSRLHRRHRIKVPMNSSIQVLNKYISNRVFRSSRSNTFQAWGYAPGTAATGVNVLFDPSGTYGVGPGSLTMTDWNNFKLVFDQYRVNKIKVTFSCSDTASDGNSLSLYCRYNYDLNFGTPTLALMSDLPRVIKKQFTPDFPSWSYTIYPRVDTLVYNGAVLASQGHRIGRMGWCDVNNPVALMGMVFYFTPTNTNQELWVDVEYDISYRMNT